MGSTSPRYSGTRKRRLQLQPPSEGCYLAVLGYCSPLMAMLSELDVPVLVPQITVLPQSTLKASVVLVPQMTVVPK